MARISSGLACACSISQAIRSTRTVVFPVPAPARTSAGPQTCSMAACCFGLGMNFSLTKRPECIMRKEGEDGNGENQKVEENREGIGSSGDPVIGLSEPTEDKLSQSKCFDSQSPMAK